MHRQATRRRTRSLMLIILLLLMMTVPHTARAEAGQWEVRHPMPVELSEVSAVLEAGDRVRVYAPGALLESADGTDWTVTPITPAITIIDTARGPGGGLVASDGMAVYHSTDGIRWTKRFEGYYKVEYLGGQYVTVGSGGIWISADGLTWKQRLLKDAYSIVYGDGQYLAAGGNAAVYLSADGQTWSRQEGIGQPLTGVAYGNGLFVGYLQNRPFLKLSRDGMAWEEIALSAGPYSLIFGDGRFVAVGWKQDRWVLLLSADGRDWTEYPVPNNETSFEVLEYRDGYYIGASYNAFYRSQDGVTWTPLAGWHRGTITSAVYGQGRWLATGERGALLTSPDGVAWTERDLGTAGDVNEVIYAAGRFVAVGEEGIWTSPTGLAWTKVSEGRRLMTVAYGEGRFVALGLTDEAWTSADGVAWVKSAAPAGLATQVAYGGGRFVAVGSPAYLGGDRVSYAYVSADGYAWSTVDLAPGVVAQEVAYYGGQFAAVGTRGVVQLSADGAEWTVVELDPNVTLDSVSTGEGGLVAIGRDLSRYQPVLAVSADGVTWQLGEGPDVLWSVAEADGRMLGVGDKGLIYDLVDPGRPTPPCEPPLPDVSVYNPACRAVAALYAAGVVQGRGTQGFVPEGQLTRAEFATMLVRAMGWSAAPGKGNSFTDVLESHWAHKSGAIQAAVAHGAFSGFPDGTFKPDQPISRSELVKIAAAVAGLKPGGAAEGYVDVAGNDWFSGWVGTARSARLIGPEAGGGLWADPYFHGREAATRNEAALLLWNLMNQRR